MGRLTRLWRPNGESRIPTAVASEQRAVGWQEAARALVVAQGIIEGYWRVAVEFGATTGVNLSVNGERLPAAILPVVRLRLMRDTVPNGLTVDAATVWRGDDGREGSNGDAGRGERLEDVGGDPGGRQSA